MSIDPLRALSHAYVRHGPDEEGSRVLRSLARRGGPVERSTYKRIRRLTLPLTPGTLVAGETPSAVGALGQLGVPVEESVPQVLAKPMGHAKRLTGPPCSIDETDLLVARWLEMTAGA